MKSFAKSTFILECLDRGLYPSWDAYNKEALVLAEKLEEYLVYETHAEGNE